MQLSFDDQINFLSEVTGNGQFMIIIKVIASWYHQICVSNITRYTRLLFIYYCVFFYFLYGSYARLLAHISEFIDYICTIIPNADCLSLLALSIIIAASTLSTLFFLLSYQINNVKFQVIDHFVWSTLIGCQVGVGS